MLSVLGSPLMESKPAALKVVLIEDGVMFRQILRLVLEKQRGWTDIQEFADGQQGLDYCLQNPPDLLIVDWELPNLNGVEVAAALKQRNLPTKVVLLTGNPDESLPAQLMAAGVTGYLDKGNAYDQLLQAVDAVLAGQVFFSARLQGTNGSNSKPPLPEPTASKSRPPLVPLTPIELEVARRVVAGLTSKEIADELKLTARSIDKHRANLMRKAGVNQAASLVRWCIENNVVS